MDATHVTQVDNLNTAIGLIAAACTTGSFVPQLVKIHKQGGRDLSYAMLLLYLLGVALWLAYGLRINAAEIILANIVAGLLIVAALVMKRRSELRASRVPTPTPTLEPVRVPVPVPVPVPMPDSAS